MNLCASVCMPLVSTQPKRQPAAEWHCVDNLDGTVSLRSSRTTWLTAQADGGVIVSCTRSRHALWRIDDSGFESSSGFYLSSTPTGKVYASPFRSSSGVWEKVR